ncbi:molybdate ABC transporter substrate-binding protein [soil metagenome]
MRSSRTRSLSLVCAFALMAGAGCNGGEEPDGAAPAGDELTGDATIFTAASLTGSFEELKEIFEAENPGTTISLNLGSSSGLATQIVEQGGADAFASADRVNMKKVTDQDLTDGEPEIFIRNVLAIIVAPGNPKRISSLADLANPDLKVIMAAPQVPIGRYGREALQKAGVSGVNPVSDAIDVKGVVGPVTLGEADAGIVYVSDIQAVGDEADQVEIPEEHNVDAQYPIALIKDGPNPAVGRSFVDFVLSDEGTKVLTDNGFTAV